MDKAIKRFCLNCCQEQPTRPELCTDTLNVLGKRLITVTTVTRVCDVCGKDVGDRELMDLTLKAAYAEYERITGEPVRKGVVETKNISKTKPLQE